MNDFAKPTVMLPAGEPSISTWRDKATYRERLIVNFLSPLEEANRKFGKAPAELQRAVIEHLHWYFTTDLRERAPTVVVNEPMAVEFHALVGRIMYHIDIETIASLDSPEISNEVKHALLSYKKPHCHSPVSLDALDHDQGLVRITYYLHGDKPSETFLLDGQETQPAYAKYRGCRFFRRMLMRERIVWLPVENEKSIEVLLDGKPTEITLREQRLIADRLQPPTPERELLTEARLAFPPGDQRTLPFTLSSLKTRLFRWIAQLPPFRKRFERAWVFADRNSNADDNAEELYRWVRDNHSEINIWFLLAKESDDWKRLSDEGFRLVPPGPKRTLLLINAENIVSSHVEYSQGIFTRSYLGEILTCKFHFIPHGISMNDVSHWLNPQQYDYIATTSPAEYSSFVDDDTPYVYTSREVHLTGFPRQDRINNIASRLPRSVVRNLLVMPTWRAEFVDGRSEIASDAFTGIYDSEYMCRWREFLNSNVLKELTTLNGIKVVLMLHENMRTFLGSFSPPAHIKTIDHFSKKIMCQSVALVTDYTSVAFELARLRRPTFYYQFDRETFYGGSHNWRRGYFDYDRDGFGPVAQSLPDLLGHIGKFIDNKCRTSEKFLSRMEHAMPIVDSRSSERVFSGIVNVRNPFRSLEPAPNDR